MSTGANTSAPAAVVTYPNNPLTLPPYSATGPTGNGPWNPISNPPLGINTGTTGGVAPILLPRDPATGTGATGTAYYQNNLIVNNTQVNSNQGAFLPFASAPTLTVPSLFVSTINGSSNAWLASNGYSGSTGITGTTGPTGSVSAAAVGSTGPTGAPAPYASSSSYASNVGTPIALTQNSSPQSQIYASVAQSAPTFVAGKTYFFTAQGEISWAGSLASPPPTDYFQLIVGIDPGTANQAPGSQTCLGPVVFPSQNNSSYANAIPLTLSGTFVASATAPTTGRGLWVRYRSFNGSKTSYTYQLTGLSFVRLN